MRKILKFLLFSFKLTEETLKFILYNVIKTTLAYIKFSFFFQFYAKVSDYGGVRLWSHQTIDMHPNTLHFDCLSKNLTAMMITFIR